MTPLKKATDRVTYTHYSYHHKSLESMHRRFFPIFNKLPKQLQEDHSPCR